MTRFHDLPRPGDPAVRPRSVRDAAPTAAEISLAPTIGVLGVQGDVSEHAAALERAGARVVWVKRTEDLDRVDGLVLPGGESTAQRRLLDYEALLDGIRRRAWDGMPVFGTCAGAILAATDVVGAPVPHLSVGEGVRVLARERGEIVLAETDRALIASFHPELTGDDRLHRRFVEMVRAAKS